jgi:hypothetical protein
MRRVACSIAQAVVCAAIGRENTDGVMVPKPHSLVSFPGTDVYHGACLSRRIKLQRRSAVPNARIVGGNFHGLPQKNVSGLSM